MEYISAAVGWDVEKGGRGRGDFHREIWTQYLGAELVALQPIYEVCEK